MAASIAHGYAASGTDAGHAGPDAGFALGHPEKVKDFGWRAVHDMAVQSKTIASAFYGKAPLHSYFAACSDGGREALMEAQRFPTDFEGILAGAPAYNWTALLSAAAEDQKVHGKLFRLHCQKIKAIADAVRTSCDAQDGVKDGILADPRQCSFDPATLACKQEDTDSCLVPDQIATLKTIYSAKLDAAGKQIFLAFSRSRRRQRRLGRQCRAVVP